MTGVSGELGRRIEALRRPLLFASSDGFDGLDRVRGLGETLRAACDRAISVADGAEDAARMLRAWRTQLARFERLDRAAQCVEVARGLRLCQTIGGRARAGVGTGTGTKADVVDGAGERSVLMDPVTVLPGIGPAKAERLAERGIETVEDLVWLVPRRYDDVRRVLPLGEALAEAEVGARTTCEGTVESCRFNRRGRRAWVDLRLGDGGRRLVVRWFNARGPMAKRFPRGSRVALSGILQLRGGVYEMANPDVLCVTHADGTRKAAAARIIPRYTQIPGVPPATLRKACVAAVARAKGAIVDGVPAAVAERLGMVGLAEALFGLHAPPEDLPEEAVAALDAGTSDWHRRLAFDELFVLGLAVARRRRAARADVAVPCPRAPGLDEALAQALPFEPTGAQRRAIAAIAADLEADVPMNRLLQGDVGSGKTAVAFAAALQVARAGRQVALMAPTEILAEQHFATLDGWCRAVGLEAVLLTASTPRGVRASLLARLAAGEIDVAVGTHALIADGVAFSDLGLVIVDEQHRFGVAQRVRLRAKGDGSAPHLLVMTATPIPRTLALTAYGDLDVTIIDELPPGRTPAQTSVLAGARGRDRAERVVRKRVAAGERVFVVCPLIEASPDDEVRRDWADATGTAARLAARLSDLRVGLVHGRMTADERDAAMRRFKDGDLDILVATTVVEVGVDVPEATVMMIEDAHTFGLAQLHQLRGRVGRGGGKSWCLLMTRGKKTDAGRRRLEVMAETSDGFRIAEEDLSLRGPGELLGVRQAGLPKLRFGDLAEHAELLLTARTEADALLESDPDLARPEHADTRRVLEMRAGLPAYGAEGG